MEKAAAKNRDHITKKQFMDTVINYLGTLPFDAERFALIVQEYIQDDDINTYLEAIIHDYEQGDDVDEVEARGVAYDKASPFFTQIFAQYYNEQYLKDIVENAQADIEVSASIAEVLETPIREQQSKLHTQKIQQAFDMYPSSQARKSMIAGAQKILIHELIKNSAEVWQDDYISI